MAQKTPLYEKHLSAEGRVVDFAGFELPVQYETGIIAEHNAVRTACGLFDVSHMGESIVEGPRALDFLNLTMTNSFTSMKTGAARYTIMLYENGGAVDDLIVYKLDEEKYLLVLNASNTQKDIEWMRSRLIDGATLTDISDSVAQLAVQGPKARDVLSKICDVAELPEKYYTFNEHIMVAGCDCLVSRTGYTGEFGYEIYLSPENAPAVWDALVANGAIPCGLGARDTLRLEAAMPLYGHELSDKIDPLTAGLGFAVKLDKPDFCGKQALEAMGTPTRKRVGLKVVGRGIVRENERVFCGDKQVGVTSSGTYCPFLNAACAMAYVESDSCNIGDSLTAEVRGRRISVEVVELPFYKSKK